jgi:hypothetical protein
VGLGTVLLVGTTVGGNSAGETVYRVFMGFYGLVFPAYVWVCVVPNDGLRPTGRHLLVFALSVLCSLPMYWIGFVEGRVVWLVPGVAVILIAGIAVRSFRREPLPHSAGR